MRRFGLLDIHDFVTPDRRSVIKALGLGAGVFLSELALSRSVLAQPKFAGNPFTLGIASGDPSADGMVLWTRLAPEPLAVGGGMPSAAVEVKWFVSADESMAAPVRTGMALAKPERAHAVHVEVAGLEADREYFYCFEAGGVRSTVGRTKTLPRAGSEGIVRFASAGCQRYEDGFFTAWRRIAEERLDFVMHYGDYIYEYKKIGLGDHRPVRVVREMPGEPEKCTTLEDFRNRYAIYKLDADLQAAHASAPFFMSFDDHEVENNWAGFKSEVKGTSLAAMALRRAAAFQAWFEHMPLRAPQSPKGSSLLAHRRIDIGNLIQLNILDTRQYRSPQACGDGWKVCPEAKAKERTMLGKAQEDWLTSNFRQKRAAWTVLAQQVPVGRFDRNPDPAITEVHMDKWDGAEAARSRLYDAIANTGTRNVVVLAGDVHQNRVNELRRNFDDPASPVMGVEFVSTSIASNGDGIDRPGNWSDIMSANPHLRYFNAQRGFVRHSISAERWHANYVTLDKVSEKDAPAKTRARFVIESGKPRLQTI